jgi:hypothetical protein
MRRVRTFRRRLFASICVLSLILCLATVGRRMTNDQGRNDQSSPNAQMTNWELGAWSLIGHCDLIIGA